MISVKHVLLFEEKVTQKLIIGATLFKFIGMKDPSQGFGITCESISL